MKQAVLIFFLLIQISVSAQISATVTWTNKTALPRSETIYYQQDSSLKWEDFEAAPKDMGIVAAITFSGFGYQAAMQTTDGESVLKVKIYCYFNKQKSWVKPDKKTPEILRHEQIHFDISYLSACLFANKVKVTSFPNKDINALLPGLYDEAVKEMDHMQDAYDTQTMNGRDKEKQAAWSKKIQQQLAAVKVI